MEVILKASNITKMYSNKTALDNVSLQLEKGKILGLLGPNGGGKTTLLKMVAGLTRPTSGDILIDNNEPGIYTKSIVSYLPDVNYLYRWMKIKDALEFFKDFYKDFDENKAKELLEFMKLNESQKVTTLSKGMIEKLNLSLVLSRKAKLYLLDEPLGGVDPVARDQILDAILENYSEDSSMVVSTHLVSDIERLFDDVAFISEGRIVLTGNAEELRLNRGKSIDELFREVFRECWSF